MVLLRIIGGKWRSRRIESPPTDRTRPMPDRIKGSVFDILGARLGTPGAVPELRVADFFAGSGSLGLEAVSRGAAGCVFIERDRAVLQVLRRNLEVLRAGPQSRVAAGDAWRRSLSSLLGQDGPVGLAFVDPPYADSRDCSPKGKASRLLRRLVRGRWLTMRGRHASNRDQQTDGSLWIEGNTEARPSVSSPRPGDPTASARQMPRPQHPGNRCGLGEVPRFIGGRNPPSPLFCRRWWVALRFARPTMMIA
jgi:16S rRNA (guanine966-N2)-methyltransferase